MGIVYKAHHVFLKTAHAIKVILPELVGNDPTLATRFRQEAMAAAAIRHPNIISVTDYGVIKGMMPFLVMEFVPGQSLHELLKTEGKLSPQRALEFMIVIASGVSAAHRHGIVHRDLKPLNIMLQDNKPPAEAVKILDFGLAKIKSGELLGSFVLAQTIGMMGSPHYMAPEQWSDGELDQRSDIYSLGIILFQMLAGDVPFKGASMPTIMKKHLMDPPPHFAELDIDVPPVIEQVVLHALEKDPDKRPATAEEFIRELRQALITSAAMDRTLVGERDADFEITKQRLRAEQRAAEQAEIPDLDETRSSEAEAARQRQEEEARQHAVEEARRQAEAEKAAEERRQIEEEAQRRAAEEARREAEEEAARLRAEEERRRQAELERLRLEEEARQRAEAEAARQRAEEEARRAEEEARRRAEEEERLRAEEERRRAEEEAARLAAEAEARRKADEEARRLAEEEEARRIVEEEAKRRAAEEARKRAEEEARLKAEEEARQLAALEEEKRQAEEEARLKAIEEERLRAEAEAKRKAEEEAERIRAEEEEARRKAEEEERLRAEEARREAEEEAARLRAEEERRRQAELERLRLEEEARQRAEAEAARQRAEEEARRAEEEARRRAEEEERLRAEEEQRRAEEEAARLAAEAEARRKADEEARRATEEAARRQAEEEAARQRAEEEARRHAKEEAARYQRAQEDRFAVTVASDANLDPSPSHQHIEETQRYEGIKQSSAGLESDTKSAPDALQQTGLGGVVNLAQPVMRPMDANEQSPANTISQKTATTPPGAQKSWQEFAPPAQTSTSSLDLPTQKKPFPLIYIGAALLVLLLGGGGLYLLTRRATDSKPGPSPQPTATGEKSPGGGAAGTSAIPAREMVFIAGGTFQMGRNDGPSLERPAHIVTVKPFYIDKTEVTNAQYAEFVQVTRYPAPSGEEAEWWKPWIGDKPPPGQEQWPVRNVSVVDAKTYANWLSRRDGVTYRLPTEEEWEYVARDGSSSKLYPWGNEWVDGYANIGSSLPKPVGSYKQGATSTGVLDLIGNVWEWTSSKLSSYQGARENILQDQEGQAVKRGGSYQSKVRDRITATLRDWFTETDKHPTIGFRLVRESP